MRLRLDFVMIVFTLVAVPTPAEWYVSNATATAGEQISAEETSDHNAPRVVDR